MRFGLHLPAEDPARAWTLSYEADAVSRKLQVRAVGEDATVVSARGEETPFAEWLSRHPPTIVMSNDTIVFDGEQVLRAKASPPFDREKLVALTWTGVDRQVESQGKAKRADSVQHFVSAYLREQEAFDVLIDDDGTGEVADLVGLRVQDRELLVTLVHCKYSSESDSGARVEDLYEVCGQALRSVRWRRRTPNMLAHLAERVGRKQERGYQPFEVGDDAALLKVCAQAGQLRPRFHVIVAQPGLSKSKVRDDQLPVLAGVATYAKHTAGAKLTILVDA